MQVSLRLRSPGDGNLYGNSNKFNWGTPDNNFLVWFNPIDGAVL